MARRLGLLASLLAASVLVSACGDDTTGPVRAANVPAPRANSLPACTVPTEAELQTLALAAFTPGMPNANSVMGGQLNALKNALSNGDFAAAAAKAYEIVDFTLYHYQNSADPATRDAAALTAFTSAIYCLAGVSAPPIDDPDNSALILPSDAEQIVYNGIKTVGIKFPGNPVNEPTLVEIEQLANAPLNTKLDQYPGFVFVRVTTASGQDPFQGTAVTTSGAIVGVCAEAPGFLFDTGRLRLGHGVRNQWGDATYPGVEITPDPKYDQQLQNEGINLVCPPPVVAADLIPDEQAVPTRSGGVGGTVKTFSPLAPLDDEVTVTQRSGGVGGTVKTFDLSPFDWGNAVQSLDADGCLTYTAPIGTATSCLPSVTVRTYQGTLLSGVPVTWEVIEGAGQIGEYLPPIPATGAPASCGVASSTPGTFATGADGRSVVCWKLGIEGTNRLQATAAIGGDVPVGARFDTYDPNGDNVNAPGTEIFTAIATPPTQLAFTASPSASPVAGVAFSAAVEVRDASGARVFGYSGNVTVTLNQHTFAGGATTATVAAVQGLATFSLTINKAASGYSLSASATYGSTPLATAVTAPFGIVAAAPASMAIVSGNNQSATSGTVLPRNPTVVVSDAFGNVVSGVTVEWTATLSSGGSVSPATSLTGAAGTAFTTWTVGDGANALQAKVAGSLPAIEVFFGATGITTLSVLNSCAVGGSSDPFSDPSKPFAFYIKNPGNNKTIRSIQLYLSATGKANMPTTYDVELRTQAGTFDATVSAPKATRARVTLRGNASENAPVTFTLSSPIVGSANGPAVMVTLRALNNPDNATLLFNTGPCSPGNKCKIPPGCAVTEVSSPLPYPAGTLYRQSVGIVVRGS
jgi:hypothetical protein